jgi:copper(I)-binding protein
MRTFLLASLLAAGPALAQAPQIRADAAWARATAPGQSVGAAYATLTSPVPDRLVAVETPLTPHAGLHTMTMDGSVMRMRPVDGVALPAGQPIALAPGGTHIMLMDLKAPLKAGQRFPLTLRFERAAPLTVDVQVKPIGARGP